MNDPRQPIEARLRAAGLPPLPRTAWLEIDLGRLAGNVRAIVGGLPAGTLVDAVVKANGYGHGAVAVAHAALAAGAHGLCVATLDEALELRAAGIRPPILVLFPVPPDGIVEAARAGVAVAAGDALVWARGLAAYARARSRARGRLGDLDVHVGIETGLGRDGLTSDQAVAAVRALADVPGAQFAGAWSHLQAPGNAALTTRQVDRFEAALGALAAAGLPAPHRHLLASGGLLAVERYFGGARPVFDGLRVGLVLYGLAPEGLAVGAAAGLIHGALLPVLSLLARPVRVADLPAGEGIGYGPSFVTTRPSRIATLPVGYADGWPRSLGNRAVALVRGGRVPLVGTVAMDAVMADVTSVPGPPVTPDDEFVLLGEQGSERITAAELAAERTTISWEVVATMAARLPRVYTSPAEMVGIRTLTEDRGVMADIALWNGDICDLEVDAIVSPASTTLWMATGVAGAIKRRGGDAIEFAAVRQGPARLGDAVVTPAGSLAARWVIHAVSIGPGRRTDAATIELAVRSAFARARELGVETIAIPALGTGVGGFPIDDGARVTVAAVRAELARTPRLNRVTFALRGIAPYEAFRSALAVVDAAQAAQVPRVPQTGDARVTLPFIPADDQRTALVEEVAREIQLRGVTGPAVLFLHASMPDGGLVGSAMTFFDPVLRQFFGGGNAPATALLADEVGIEQLIDRLEELDEESVWDA